MTLDNELLDSLPVAKIEKQSFFSFIWFIPIVAALVGGWLIYKVNSEKGDVIVVTFNQAEGVEAKRTPVRFKDVDVGKVIKVELDDDLQKVRVTIQLNKYISKHVGSGTRFWVYRPRVSINEISGLSTLLSGIYISMDLGSEKSDNHIKAVYKGLEKPPRVTSFSNGKTFQLYADKLASLDIGSPVYYRQLKVGEVIKYDLNIEKDHVDISIYVNAPYHKLVKANSRFWNSSGIDLEVTSDGLEAKMESLTSLLIGGISFDSPYNLRVRLPAKDNTFFPLYESKRAASDKSKGKPLFYIMYFEGSLRGLKIGSPVEYRGISVGKVEDIRLVVESDKQIIKIPVLVSLYVDQFSVFSNSKDAIETIEALVNKGMKAQLKTANLLTGVQYIALTIPTETSGNVEKGAIKRPLNNNQQGYAEFPTKTGFTQQLTRSATDILEEIQKGIKDIRRLVNSPDISQSTNEFSGILKDVRVLMAELKPDIVRSAHLINNTLQNTNHLVKQVSPEITSVLGMVEDAMVSTNQLINDVSPEISATLKMVRYEITPEVNSVVHEINRMVGSTNHMVETLKPDIFQSVGSLRLLLNNTQGMIAAADKDIVEGLHFFKTTLKNTALLTQEIGQEIKPLSQQTRQILVSLEKTLFAAEKTLGSANNMIGNDSAMQYEIRQLLEEVTQAANAFSVLADTLQRQPNSIIYGK